MTLNPPVGSLVTHKHVGPETIYEVLAHHWKYHDMVMVKYFSGAPCFVRPAGTEWAAAASYLEVTLPRELRFPQGI